MSPRDQAAEHYIAANKSDPFCRKRVYTHMRTGVTRFTAQGEDAFYSASPCQEERVTAFGTPYKVTVYRNIIRP